MKQAVKTRNITPRVLIIIAAALVLALAVTYLSRGWIRMTLLPRTVAVISGNGPRKTFEAEFADLQDPFHLLGHPNPELSKDNGCSTSYADGFKTKVNCVWAMNSWYEISQNAADKEALNANAEKLQALLQANGWDGNYGDDEDNTLKKLLRNITDGIDYYPDATYIKETNGTFCILSTTTAFSSPKPAAINTHMSCSREYNVFGDPLAYPVVEPGDIFED